MEIEVGPFVKSMRQRPRSGSAEIIVYVCEATSTREYLCHDWNQVIDYLQNQHTLFTLLSRHEQEQYLSKLSHREVYVLGLAIQGRYIGNEKRVVQYLLLTLVLTIAHAAQLLMGIMQCQCTIPVNLA